MHPATQCDGNLEKNKVSKLFAKKQFAKEEYISHVDTIEKLDPKGEFTLKLHESCDISSKHFTQINKCKNFNNHVSSNPKQPQLVYDYGGLDLSMAAKQFSFEELFIAMRSIFKGLVILSSNQYAHLDIKPGNIVYNNLTKKMALIDFGLVSSFKDIVKSNNLYLFNHPYPYYPPEFDVYLNYYLHKTSFAKNFKNKNLNLSKNYGAFNKILNHLDKDLSWRHDINPNEIYDTNLKTMKKFIDRIDIYMLGVTLLELLILCFNYHKTSNINVNSEFFKDVIELIKKMTRFSPHLRISPSEAYKEYKKITLKIFKIPDSLPQPSAVKVKVFYKGPTLKECKPGKIRNPKTGRCIKDCVRNPKTGKCLKECAQGKIRNPKTGRCVKGVSLA
jgi:serine/threonine protein kinase